MSMRKYRFSVIQPKSGSIPSPRSGHRCVTDDIFLYVFGGYSPLAEEKLFSEIWCFNLSLQKWLKLETTGPLPVCVASATLVLKQRNLIVFGGSGYPFGTNSSNKTFVCHLNNKTWEEIQCSTGTADQISTPVASYGQSAVIGPNCSMYVFGGTRGLDYINELYKLDLKSYCWEHIVCREAPSPRYRHEAISIHGGFIVIGGYGGEGACPLDKVHVFKYGDKTWHEVICQPDEQYHYPSPRRAHSCVCYNGYIYVCGGYDEASDRYSSNVFDDVWRLDPINFLWYKMDQVLPSPRFFHSAAVTTTGCMYIYGGVEQKNRFTQSRTSQVVKMWLVIPPLLELSWQKLCDTSAVGTPCGIRTLASLGIPRYLIARLYQHTNT